MTVYQIAHWPKHFENAKSRGLARCSHVYMPNKQDGLTFNRLMAHPNGTTIFGMWCLILQACSRHKDRNGWLTDDGTEKGTPWTVEDLAFRWRRPLDEVQQAVEFLCSDRIGWIKKLAHKYPSEGYREDTERAARHPSTEQNRTEQNSTHEDTTGDLDKPAQQGGDGEEEKIYRTASLYVDFRVKDPERTAENRATLIYLFRTHPELAKSIAEGHRHQTAKKLKVWELESMIAEKLAAEKREATCPIKTQAIALIRKHGWEKCREAADWPHVDSESKLLFGMESSPDILRQIADRLGAA